MRDGTVRLWTALLPANNDGVVNIADLVEVAQNFGQVGDNKADINGDGIVNVVVISFWLLWHWGEVAAAPAAHAEAFDAYCGRSCWNGSLKPSKPSNG